MQKSQVPVKVKKPVRTISGVTPLTVVLEPRKCDHGTCIYCPGGDHVPQSYTDKSPAIMRALALSFDPYEQVKNRLHVLKKMNHPTDKIELIVLGGTFLQYPIDYQYNFVKRCFDALNEKNSESLEEAKKLNENSRHRCVAMCIENRPDNCSEEEIKRMLEFGCTRVEIGVQMPDNELYRKTNRGHTIKDVVTATKNLKNSGFKLGYHIMPGLPYSNPEKDMEMFKKIFSDEKFCPDQLKIYPCQVVDDSPLAKTHRIIGFKPYSEEETKEILEKMLKEIPRYCRVMRMMREFPKEKLIAGVKRLDLRKDVEDELRASETHVNEIRMREIGFNKNIDPNAKLKTIEYNASEGKEFFLEFVNKKDILFGLLRLRIFGDEGLRSPVVRDINDSEQTSSSFSFNKQLITKEISNQEDESSSSLKFSDESRASGNERGEAKNKVAIVRELHVYGQAIKIGGVSHNLGDTQHRGIGKLLLEKAEEIAKENSVGKLFIISGVGVREYYRKFGYRLEGNYMAKNL